MIPRDIFMRCLAGPWSTSGEDVQYYLAPTDEGIGLYFQGSSSASDWAHNFDVAVVPYKQMAYEWKAHSGFVRLWKSVREEIFAALPQASRLTIAGYSQGAALALLAYEDASFRNYAVQGYGFGCPRVLWGSAPAVFEDFQRYSRWGDPVTMLPPWISGYRHVGKDHRIGAWSLPNGRNHLPEAYLGALP